MYMYMYVGTFQWFVQVYMNIVHVHVHVCARRDAYSMHWALLPYTKTDGNACGLVYTCTLTLYTMALCVCVYGYFEGVIYSSIDASVYLLCI